MCADHGGPAVSNDILDFLRLQAVVDWDENSTDLRYGVERLEMSRCIETDVRNPITLPNPQTLQCLGPAITARKELLVREPGHTIDDTETLWIEGSRPPLKLQGGKGYFHVVQGSCRPQRECLDASQYLRRPNRHMADAGRGCSRHPAPTAMHWYPHTSSPSPDH